MAVAGTLLEVALNGPFGPAAQPNAPYLIEAIIDDAVNCAAAGANVIHIHPYDERSGSQNDDLETYIRIIEGIRERVDIIVYPTAPFGAAQGPRFTVTEELAKRGLLEWATVDPGTTNVVRAADLDQPDPGFIYENRPATVRAGLDVCARHGLTPAFAIYEPGFMRLGRSLAESIAGLPDPIYRLMFSSEFLFGFPPSRAAIDAYAALGDQLGLRSPVMIAGLGVDMAPSIPAALERGWHIRVGLEDMPFGCEQSNVELVSAAAARIERAGGRLADAARVRAQAR